MKQDLNIKYNAYGEVDVDYYIYQAKQMRSEYMAKQLSALGKKIHYLVHKIAEKLFGSHTHVTH